MDERTVNLIERHLRIDMISHKLISMSFGGRIQMQVISQSTRPTLKLVCFLRLMVPIFLGVLMSSGHSFKVMARRPSMANPCEHLSESPDGYVWSFGVPFKGLRPSHS